VLESTTYPGTTEEVVVRILTEGGAPRGVNVQIATEPSDLIDGVLVAFSPEREDPGNMITPRREIPKVVGGMDATATEAACALYGSIFTRTVAVSSPATAEMTKLLENIYRSVNIALVNEMKQLCMKMGVDIWEVIDAAATKPFGFQPFYPGPGIGGHCIPVDPFYLTWKAKEYGFTTRFIQLAGEVNESMPSFVVEQVARALNDRAIAMKGAKVLVLGVAYKPDVDDLRESPSLVIIELLQSLGCEVSYNDPFFPFVGHGRKYALNMQSTPLDRVGEFDCVVVTTDHSAYEMESIVEAAKLVVDSRNATRQIQSPKVVRC
jgi:UDP-N-acetyl-D-glucosamine dehydrogenase